MKNKKNIKNLKVYDIEDIERNKIKINTISTIGLGIDAVVTMGAITEKIMPVVVPISIGIAILVYMNASLYKLDYEEKEALRMARNRDCFTKIKKQSINQKRR